MENKVPLRTRKPWECPICMDTVIPRDRSCLLCGHMMCIHCVYKIILHSRYPIYQVTDLDWMGTKVPYVVKSNAPPANCPFCRELISPIVQFCVDREYHRRYSVNWDIERDKQWQSFWDAEKTMIETNKDAYERMIPQTPSTSPVTLDEVPSLHDLFIDEDSDNDWDVDLGREHM